MRELRPRRLKDVPSFDARADEERDDIELFGGQSSSLVPAKTREEMEVEAKRLFLCARLGQFGKGMAVTILHQHFPKLPPSILGKLVVGWLGEIETITKKAGATWGREQLAILLLRSQMRASSYDQIAADTMAVAAEGVTPETLVNLASGRMESMSAARSEDMFQVQLIKQMQGLGDAMLEEEDDTPEQREGRFAYIESLKTRVTELRADGSAQERVTAMEKATYGK